MTDGLGNSGRDRAGVMLLPAPPRRDAEPGANPPAPAMANASGDSARRAAALASYARTRQSVVRRLPPGFRRTLVV